LIVISENIAIGGCSRRCSRISHEEKRWVAQEDKYLIDSLRDVLDPLAWDIVRRPPGARRRPTSAEKKLKKILRTKLPKRRKSGR
jgi:hypothetical protein